ncbi:hypothetical protein B4U79_00759, partial [Dinothrombium tinctorium]
IARSKTKLIPWNTYNVVRLLFAVICLLLNLLELSNHLYLFFSSKVNSSSDFIASLMKIATFVSCYFDKNLNY